jgi:hypothetical protein
MDSANVGRKKSVSEVLKSAGNIERRTAGGGMLVGGDSVEEKLGWIGEAGLGMVIFVEDTSCCDGPWSCSHAPKSSHGSSS